MSTELTPDMEDELGHLFVEQLKQQARDFGVDLKAELQETTAFIAERLTHLQTVVGQPGYDRAAAAEANSILMEATLNGIDSADAADQQLVAFTRGMLMFGVKVIDVLA